MPGNLDAECLVAVTGLFPEDKPSREQRSLARKFPKRLADRVRAFLDSEKRAKYQAPKLPKNQTKLHDKITEQVDLDQIAEWFTDEPDLGLAYAMVMQAGRDKVVAAWPVFPDPSLGVHNFDLGVDELLNVLQELKTLDSVESLFDDLDAFVLLPSQVATFAANYPELYASVQAETGKALTPYLEAPGFVERRKALDPFKEDQIRILLQLEPDAVIELQPQGQPGQEGQGPGRPRPRPESEGPALATPSEHTTENRVSR
jgi:hypothetical protein